jgi:hypothetical protein
MLLVLSLFRWWYGDGFRQRVKFISNGLEGMIDYFSFGLLLKTLFSPYRQISAGSVDGPLEVKMRAMLDKLFSRVIGAVIRLMIIVVGGLIVGFVVMYSLLTLVIWGLVPFLPIVGFVMMTVGWVPEWKM